jgi:hypothetical protein
MTFRTLATRVFLKMPVDQRDLLARDQFIDGLTEDALIPPPRESLQDYLIK